VKNLFVIILFSLFISCEGIEIGKPISTNNDTTLFTVEGKYMNGSTNTPYRNIELTLKMDNYGYPRVLEEIDGPIRTDNNGYFKFTYRFIDRAFPIFLKVYPTDLYPEIDSLPMNQNLNLIKYKSTYGNLVLSFNPTSSKDLYVIIAGQLDTMHYVNITESFVDTIRSLPYSSVLLAWGRTKEELRQAIKGGNGNQSYVKISGDPFFNHHKITF